MQVDRLWLVDFRSYAEARVDLAPGLTAIVGGNGQGKTNLLEALGWLATLSSFRGAPPEAMVREGCERAVVRAEGDREGRRLLVEGELRPGGRTRVQVNRQPLKRARDLLGTLRVTVFSPDDLALVKGGPAERRRYLDEVLVALHPRHDQLQRDVERVLRQRATLLRQAGATPAGRRGQLDADVAVTLDVWDAKLADLGEALAAERESLVRALEPAVSTAYDRVAAVGARVALRYQAPWREGGLAAALAAARADDLRRAATTVGPHRDELVLSIAGLPARTHASQGEQRSLALALRLGAHATVAEAAGSPPVLLLDDVFSELDGDRAAALLAHLPAGQAVLTTTGPLPAPATPDLVVSVRGGRIAA